MNYKEIVNMLEMGEMHLKEAIAKLKKLSEIKYIPATKSEREALFYQINDGVENVIHEMNLASEAMNK